jgi:uncharacterized protein YndB with AHSA1/START domain
MTAERVIPFAVPPVVKTVTVRCAPEKAFRLFTADLANWWPLSTHHMAPHPQTCVFEPRAGGRVYERATNGVESQWGIVEVWDPPHRLAFTWQVRRTPEETQRVEVTFTSAAEGTRVELVHSGWEKLGERAASVREAFDKGWVAVFEQGYANYANAQ